LKNNILLTGGLSRLGMSIIKRNYKKNCIFYILRSSLKKKFYNDPENKIKYINFNFLGKNIEKKLKEINKIKKIDVYIQMANYNPGKKEIYYFSQKDLIKSYKINYFLHFLILQIVYKKMLYKKKGRIVNISSYSAKSGGNKIYPYSSMKAAMDNTILSLKTDQKFNKKNINFQTYNFKNISNFEKFAKKVKLL
jgi:NAD(P)-dependent dehydrogenase (short-subunit alcohol dehydrogenase family)